MMRRHILDKWGGEARPDARGCAPRKLDATAHSKVVGGKRDSQKRKIKEKEVEEARGLVRSTDTAAQERESG